MRAEVIANCNLGKHLPYYNYSRPVSRSTCVDSPSYDDFHVSPEQVKNFLGECPELLSKVPLEGVEGRVLLPH